MKLKHYLGVGALIGALAGGAALAQSVIYQNLTGNECWSAGEGPGGPSAFLCADVLRNSAQKVVAAATGALTFGSGTLATLRYGGNVLITTQPLATTTFTLSPNPVQDGALAGLCNVTNSAYATTNIAFAASTSQSFVPLAVSTTSLGAHACIYVQFNRANTTWYWIQ